MMVLGLLLWLELMHGSSVVHETVKAREVFEEFVRDLCAAAQIQVFDMLKEAHFAQVDQRVVRYLDTLGEAQILYSETWIVWYSSVAAVWIYLFAKFLCIIYNLPVFVVVTNITSLKNKAKNINFIYF